MVDWKTINKESAKNQTASTQKVSDLYTNPIQIAAYVAAVNSSMLYKDFPVIEDAAVVLAYEGREHVEVVKMDKECLQVSIKSRNIL